MEQHTTRAQATWTLGITTVDFTKSRRPEWSRFLPAVVLRHLQTEQEPTRRLDLSETWSATRLEIYTCLIRRVPIVA